jgi:hypothetical protein
VDKVSMKSRASFDPEFDAPAKGREKGKPKPRRLVGTLITLGVISPVVVFMLSPIWGSPNFGKPHGRAIPDQPPDEANRVVNPQGFSIVFPPNWETHVEDSKEFPVISANPRTVIPSRWEDAALAVERWPEDRPPDLADFKPTVFQGKAAYERISTHPGTGDFPDRRPPRFIDLLAFQRNGAWYRLIYWVTDDRKTRPPIMLRYFNTFRVDHGA